VKADLRHQWRHRDLRIAADESGGIQRKSGEMTGNNAAEYQPTDSAI
jgi:hypothetical protein